MYFFEKGDGNPAQLLVLFEYYFYGYEHHVQSTLPKSNLLGL